MLVSQQVNNGMAIIGVKDATLASVGGRRLAELARVDGGIEPTSNGFVVGVWVGLGPGQAFTFSVFY